MAMSRNHVQYRESYDSTEDLVQALHEYGPIEASDNKLSISKYVIRCQKRPLVAVAGDRSEKEQINAFLDALHWNRHRWGGASGFVFLIGRGKRASAVIEAIGTLRSVLGGRVETEIQLGTMFEPTQPRSPNFSSIDRGWLAALQRREEVKLPQVAVRLADGVNAPSFRWYRSLRGDRWSGRVEGLEVCRIGLTDTSGVIAVGRESKRGAESKARRQFRELTGENQIHFDQDNLEVAVEVIRRLVVNRQTGELFGEEREHYLESQVLRQDVKIQLSDGRQLRPVVQDVPFQLPTLWSTYGRAKYIDVLMSSDDVPWVLELKVASGGQGQYYRHAVGQVVLYQEFLRRATKLHAWFENRGLDATKTEAAVAYPRLRGRQAGDLQDDISYLAEAFGIQAMALD